MILYHISVLGVCSGGVRHMEWVRFHTNINRLQRIRVRIKMASWCCIAAKRVVVMWLGLS